MGHSIQSQLIYGIPFDRDETPLLLDPLEELVFNEYNLTYHLEGYERQGDRGVVGVSVMRSSGFSELDESAIAEAQDTFEDHREAINEALDDATEFGDIDREPGLYSVTSFSI